MCLGDGTRISSCHPHSSTNVKNGKSWVPTWAWCRLEVTYRISELPLPSLPCSFTTESLTCFVHAWLVTVTYLHHTDVFLPHYSPKEWNFVPEALMTVETRSSITLTTVMSSTISSPQFLITMQFWLYLKDKLGEYYACDRMPIWKALFRSFKYCYWVEADKDVVFYRKWTQFSFQYSKLHGHQIF